MDWVMSINLCLPQTQTIYIGPGWVNTKKTTLTEHNLIKYRHALTLYTIQYRYRV